MSSRKQNSFRPGVEQLEQRDVPSATLGSIPGLATAAVNSDFNSHVVSALGKSVQRQMPPAGTYAGEGNAKDHAVIVSYPTSNAVDAFIYFAEKGVTISYTAAGWSQVTNGDA